jgi:archaellum biogenesis ATPase FlaH
MYVPGSPLASADYQNLARCGIDQSLADEAQLRRVDTWDGASLVGQDPKRGDYSGIAFPYFDIWSKDEPVVVEYQLRRDNPELEQTANGQLKPTRKYLWPPGRRARLYVFPGTDRALLADATVPVLIVEGAKKCLALHPLAWYEIGEAGDKPHFVPLGLSGGCWGWRGTIGKTAGPDGTPSPVKGPISDLDHLTWDGRRVLLLYDRNVHSNESVRAARNGLATVLRGRGARVEYVDIPFDVGPDINGIDDLVGKWGPKRVLDLIQTAAYDPSKKTTEVDIDSIPSVFSVSAGPIEFVVEGVLALGAVTMLAGEAGNGKSTLASSAAWHVAHGQEFLGKKCQQRNVLYLDGENTSSVVQERLKRLGLRDGEGFVMWGCWHDRPPELQGPGILEWVLSCPEKPLIIVDSLIAFLDSDENDAVKVRRFMQQLRRWAEAGAAVLALHHSGKSETSQQYRGSSDFKASIDVGYVLTNSRNGQLDRLRLKTFKNRFSVDAELAIEYVDGRFHLDGKTQQAKDNSTEELQNLLRVHPGIGAAEFEALARKSGLGRNQSRQFLKNGKTNGSIQVKRMLNNHFSHTLVE